MPGGLYILSSSFNAGGNIQISTNTLASGSNANYGLQFNPSLSMIAGGSLTISVVGNTIAMDSSSKFQSAGNLDIYEYSPNGYNGIWMGSGAIIRSTGGSVNINSVGYNALYMADQTATIRANGNLTINLVGTGSAGTAFYNDGSVACANAGTCGFISDTGNLSIYGVSQSTSYAAIYIATTVIANGSTSGNGNITILGMGQTGGVTFGNVSSGSAGAYSSVSAYGGINIVGYGGSSGGNGIYFASPGPSVSANSGGILRSTTGNITLSAYSANNAGIEAATSTNIVALAGNVVMQGASLSGNLTGALVSANTALASAYSAIIAAMQTSGSPTSATPSGFAAASTGNPILAKYWGIYWTGNIYALNNPTTFGSTAPTSGGGITMIASVLNGSGCSSTAVCDSGAAITILDGGNLYAYGPISITGNAAPAGLNATTGVNYGIIVWSTTTTIRSYAGSINMVGYADGFQTSGNFASNSDSAGIYIYDSHNIIRGYSGVSMTGIDMTGIGLYLGLWNTAGSNVIFFSVTSELEEIEKELARL